MSDETEAVAQLQAMGFEWSGTWSHWQRIHNGKNAIVLTAMSGWQCTHNGKNAIVLTAMSGWQCTHNGKNAIVLTAMSGWWAIYGRNQSPLGVTHPLDVVEWVRREMDAND